MLSSLRISVFSKRAALVAWILLGVGRAFAGDRLRDCPCFSNYPNSVVVESGPRGVQMCGAEYDLSTGAARRSFVDDLSACGVDAAAPERGEDVVVTTTVARYQCLPR